MTVVDTNSTLTFLELNVTEGVELQAVGHFDDGVSQAVHSDHLPFGRRLHNQIYVSFKKPDRLSFCVHPLT